MTLLAGDILNGGHDDRPVTRLRIDGHDVVRKRYRRADGAEVFAAMADLWSSRFGRDRRPSPGLPEPLALHQDRHGMDMAAVDGAMLAVRGDLGLFPGFIEESARLLADLHTSGVVVPRRRSADRLVASLGRKFTAERPAVLDELARVGSTLAEPLVVSHGDFTPRNVIRADHGLTLIDFDRLQMAGAGRDVQSVAAWCWATTVLTDRAATTDAWALGDLFHASYVRCRPEAMDDVTASRGFHRACGLVRIAMSWSSLRHDTPARDRVLAEAARQLTEVPTMR